MNKILAAAVLLFVLVVCFQIAVARLSLETEAKRRWQHAITGQALVLVSFVLPVGYCIAALLAGSAGMYYLRTRQREEFLRLFGPLLRSTEKEDNNLPGAFYFLLGTTVVVILFPMQLARYAVECLSLADPVAAWVGKSVRSLKINESSSLAGSIACFVIAWSVGWMLLPPDDYGETNSDDNPHSLLLVPITVGALACCITEACPYGNDNLLIPIITATAVHFTR